MFEVSGTGERVRLTVTDDGRGRREGPAPTPGIGGTGLKGLTERLAAAGGSLVAGPGADSGFVVTAELPVEAGGGEEGDGGGDATAPPGAGDGPDCSPTLGR